MHYFAAATTTTGKGPGRRSVSSSSDRHDRRNHNFAREFGVTACRRNGRMIKILFFKFGLAFGSDDADWVVGGPPWLQEGGGGRGRQLFVFFPSLRLDPPTRPPPPTSRKSGDLQYTSTATSRGQILTFRQGVTKKDRHRSGVHGAHPLCAVLQTGKG